MDVEHAIFFGPVIIVSTVYADVKNANKNCPSNSTLPQMAKISPFEKTLPSNGKDTVASKRAKAEYIEIVEKLYRDFLEGPSRAASFAKRHHLAAKITLEIRVLIKKKESYINYYPTDKMHGYRILLNELYIAIFYLYIYDY